MFEATASATHTHNTHNARNAQHTPVAVVCLDEIDAPLGHGVGVLLEMAV